MFELKPSKEKEVYPETYGEESGDAFLDIMTRTKARKFFSRMGPLCLRIVERIFNFRVDARCDTVGFQMKMARLLFWAVSTSSLFRYLKEDGEFDIDEAERYSLLSKMHSNRSAIESYLRNDVLEETFPLLELKSPNFYDCIHRIRQTRKVPPVFFPSNDLLTLFLNTDLPSDMSFLLEYYGDMEFFIHIPILSMFKVEYGDDDSLRINANGRHLKIEEAVLRESAVLHCLLRDGVLSVTIYQELVDKKTGLPGCPTVECDLKTVPYHNYNIPNAKGILINTQVAFKVIYRISEVALNLLLYGCTTPVFSSSKQVAAKGKRETKNRQSGQTPRYLGTSSFPLIHESDRTSKPDTPSGRTMTPHFRRGHWKRVPVGKGRCDRLVKWIRPTYVNLQREVQKS